MKFVKYSILTIQLGVETFGLVGIAVITNQLLRIEIFTGHLIVLICSV